MNTPAQKLIHHLLLEGFLIRAITNEYANGQRVWRVFHIRERGAPILTLDALQHPSDDWDQLLIQAQCE